MRITLGGAPRRWCYGAGTRWTLLLLATVSAFGEERASDRYDIRLKKVVDDVYVAYRPEPLRPYVEGNVAIILNEADVVVVDASGSPRTARKVIEHIRTLTRNPVRYVVLTHIHRDHRFGLQEYISAFPGVEVIAHPIVKEVIDRPSSATFVADATKRLAKAGEETEEEIAKLRKEAAPGHEEVITHLRRFVEKDLPPILDEYRTIRNLGPTATVDSKLVLHRKDRTIEILFLGRGDTDHDLVVHLPKEKLVATGDMVVHPFPYGFSNHPLEWLATLRRLEALDIEHLIPGHGDVQRGESYLRRVIALVEAVQRGGDLAAFKSEFAGDDPVRRYYFDEYFARPAVERARK